MKKFLPGAIGVAAMLTTGASAADLAARPYAKAAPMVVAAYNWTGFYIGVHAGYDWMSSTDDITAANASAVGFLTPPS